ncbi:hypothetical protein [Pacificibacter marinus]|uniref:hypothetical protein n=1 Tax=Pacificibacter marinus TaxID=658057 RepID=UPI001C068D0E|nr:hypothetical protein [Pacificibacter marinus]MBU2866767.1 hypothetical protein [Pacificibacter marinus]
MPSIIIFTAVPNFESDMSELCLKGSAWISLSSGERCNDTDTPTIVGECHHERSASFGLSMALRKMKVLGQSPIISCTVRRTRSNIALYTTNSVDCTLSLKLDF